MSDLELTIILLIAIGAGILILIFAWLDLKRPGEE